MTTKSMKTKATLTAAPQVTSKGAGRTEPLPLTEKEKSVLEMIEVAVAEKGISPSYQEIKDHFGFASFNSVQNYLKQLVQKGYIQIPSHQKRAIQILNSARSVQEAVRAQRDIEPAVKSGPEALELPLLGKVAAGRPLENFAHDEFVDVPASMVRNPQKTFALKIVGQSMIEDGIHDGDIILVQKQGNASNGEIVVATVNEESTVKRFYLKNDPNNNSNKVVELRPSNSTMTSMWYPPQEVKITGVVVGLIRKF